MRCSLHRLMGFATTSAATIVLLCTPMVLRAQTAAPVESATVSATPLSEAQTADSPHVATTQESSDFITPHITDSHHLELPWQIGRAHV